MIDSFKKIATKLTFFRNLLVVFVVVSLVLTLWCFVEFSRNQQKTVELFVPSVVGMMWSMLVFLFYVVFRRVPSDSDKLVTKSIRACFRLLVLVFAGAVAFVVYESYALISNMA